MALIDKDDLKVELDMAAADTDFDDLLAQVALAVQDLFDELTGRTSEEASHTEYYNAPYGTEQIMLNNWPVSSDTDPEVWDDPDWNWDSGDKLTIDDDFRVDRVNGIIFRDGFFYEGKQSVKVTYTAGWSTTTFPDSHKQIWVRQACQWYQDAKTKGWAIVSIGNPQGGTLTKKELVDNLLPDFVALCNRESRDI